MVHHKNLCTPRMYIIPHIIQYNAGANNERRSTRPQRYTIGGRVITNLRFADDVDGLAVSEHELVNLMNKIYSTSITYGMEINTNKINIMTNYEGHFNYSISLHGEIIESVDTFKYLGSILDDNGSTKEMNLSIIAQTTSSLTKLNPIWNDRNLTLNSKILLLHSLVS